MAANLLYVGTYTDKIHTLRLDPDNGGLVEIDATTGLAHPSYLALSADGRHLYAVNELLEYEGVRGGAVSAYRIDPVTGRLEFLNAQPTHGADPCHLCIDPTGRFLLVANYTSGHVTVLPLREDGAVAPASQVIAHEGASIHPTRQTSPHPHHVAFDRAGRHVFVSELGIDGIVSYRFDARAGRLEPACEPSRSAPGAGPRQAAPHPSAPYVYVLNELDSTIAIYADDAQTGRLTPGGTASTLPETEKDENTGAELQLAPSGRFLYASNRGHDSIAVFAVDLQTGALSPRGHASTLGSTPRQFEISPDGRWLAAANQESDTVVLFRIDPETGALSPTGATLAIRRPVCIKFATMAA